MNEKRLTKQEAGWRQQIEERKALLQRFQNELIELETELADQLAAINAFEFQLRARIRPLINRLEKLEQEIREFRQALRRDISAPNADEWEAWSVDDDASAMAGDYRYREPRAPLPPPQLGPEKSAELKRLYRQLARRFHPDIALDDADSHYRTRIMMAINAAYAAGDLEKLKELLLEPDAAATVAYARTDEQMAEALQLEIDRCRRRIAEIVAELATLASHESVRLMRRVQRATAEGRDMIAEIVDELREENAHKMVERDVLKQELESMATADAGISGSAFADAVWNASLDQAYDEDPEAQFTEWILRRHGRFYSDDDILDESD
jgi:hypothetical protein